MSRSTSVTRSCPSSRSLSARLMAISVLPVPKAPLITVSRRPSATDTHDLLLARQHAERRIAQCLHLLFARVHEHPRDERHPAGDPPDQAAVVRETARDDDAIHLP